MTRTFSVENNEKRFNEIESYFDENVFGNEVSMSGNRLELTVSCNDFTAEGKKASKTIDTVERLFGAYVDVEIF